MKSKKVLLIYPYFYTGVVKDQLFPPLGISLLSALLLQKGIEVMKLDCTFLTQDEAVKKAQEFAPDITGIYVMTTLADNALKLLDKLKGVNPGSIYTTGGPLPTLYPEKFAERFDLVFQGESAKSFPDFCRDYLDASSKLKFMKRVNPEKYPGIFSKRMGIFNSDTIHLTKEEIDECPIPDRSGYDHAKYQKMSSSYSGWKRASIMMTYGCPYSCDFCSKPIFGNQVRYRSLDRIFEEIRDIVSYGYDSLWIADDLFTFNQEFLIKFCDRLIEEGLPVSWSCLSRVDGINDSIVKAMKHAGCSKVYLGIESGNDDVLKLMNKKTDTAVIKRGVGIYKSGGIKCAGFFIVGYPGETVETIEDTFEFASSLGLDEISFNVPYPLPGSKLYERVIDISGDDWTMENETRFLYQSEFSEEWLKTKIQDTIAKLQR